MPDKDSGPDQDRDQPSLELPSLGSMLRRRKSPPEPAAEPEPVDVEQPTVAEATPTEEPTLAGGTEEPTAVDQPAVSESTEPREPVAADAVAPVGAREAEAPASAPAPEESAAVDPPAAQPSAPAAPAAQATDQTGRDDELADGDAAQDEGTAETSGAGTGFALPSLPPLAARVAAPVTGVVVGLLAVGATYLALAGCELARGTSSCGGPGLFLLLAIMTALILVGGALLRAWDVPDPGSTSFLAVGLLAVVVLLLLLDAVFSPWMLLVVPLVTAAAFAASHWVTTAFVEMD
ncbi:hypothetical protein [Nocardioides donggukensis]|uniref:Uncharacterized protein n=1 Tax=Nocardioides donggukensis TaxID=2774019 RepID=A0A927K620_9ACTN|nr:hypothetical protein [Nocardioides donggukensis]MBD8870967.1 hypothetical protein [Nocardioides donggukensis]